MSAGSRGRMSIFLGGVELRGGDGEEGGYRSGIG